MIKSVHQMLMTAMLFLFAQQVLAIDLRIKSYTQLAHALEQGYEVRTVTHFNKCTQDANNTDVLNGGVIGGHNFSEFLKYTIKDEDGTEREGIATSKTLLIYHPRLGHVYNYVRLRVFPDNKAEILAQIVDPKTYTPLTEKTYYCEISDGKDDRGLSLYMKLL